MSSHDGELIEGLRYLKRDEITPYDHILFSKESSYIKITNKIDQIISDMIESKQQMIDGQFKWEKSEKNTEWTYSMQPIFKALCQLPEKQMVDLFEIPKFREYLDPFTLRIFMESTQEIFEHPERMAY